LVNEDLILRAQEGNKHAFREIFSMYKQPVYTTAYLILKDCQYAEDIVQETFLQVYLKLSKLSNPAAFDNWLYKIAVNLSLESIRKRKKKEVLLEEEYIAIYTKTAFDPNTPEDIAVNKDFQKKLLQHVYSLTPQYAAVLVLFYYNDFSIKQIAEITNSPENTVKTRLHRARKNLEEILGNSNEEISLSSVGGQMYGAR
jgi:RNA polymerase sigma-70 factor, ECF subfamily